MIEKMGKISDKRFLYYLQRGKMKELWDNGGDEIWENV